MEDANESLKRQVGGQEGPVEDEMMTTDHPLVHPVVDTQLKSVQYSRA